MKKFYTTLVAVFVATLGFAQVAPKEIPQKSSPVLRVENTQERVLMDKIQKKTRSGSGSFEYSYWDALSFAVESRPAQYTPLLSDSLMRIGYATSSGETNWKGPQRYSMGAIYDFTSPDWSEELYQVYEDENGNLVPVPDLGKTRNFNVDSVGILFIYYWGSEVADDVVDTLTVSVAAVEDLEFTRIYSVSQNDPTDTSWMFSWADIPWDRYGDAVATANIPGASNVKYHKHVHYLTREDTTLVSGGYYTPSIYYVPLPESFKNLTDEKQIIVTYSFKSGSRNQDVSQRYDTDTLGRQINGFRAADFEDSREEYATANGREAQPQLLADHNIPLHAMELSMVSGHLFNNKYVNAAIWIGLLNRPIISVVASCNDCEWINVKEMEQRNISIRPNPATESFRLDLDEGGAAQVELYNMMGQLMHKEQTNDQTITVNVNNFNSGMYLLRVVQDGKVYTAKVMVK